MAERDEDLVRVEAVVLVALLVGYALLVLIRRISRSRPGLRIGAPIAVGLGIRFAAIAGISASGLSATLRGGDEDTFLALARHVAAQPIGRGNLPHGPYQLHTELFALELKLGFPTIGALRVVQVGLAMLGLVLIVAAVHDLAGGRAARLAAWLLAFEPASIFFNSALHKEPLMELAAGLVVFGGTMVWLRLDVRGTLLCALGGAIAVETRAYAGWFLVAAAVLLLAHAALRSLDRPFRAMPAIYAVALVAFVATPALLQASSHESLQQLQQSQDDNTTPSGLTGPNGDNLALERVDFSTRAAVLRDLPRRIRDVTLRPYPWQLGDASQRIGAAGTLVAYAVLLLLLVHAYRNRGSILARSAPLAYPLLFLLVAYSLSAGNAGTGFRYRSHLVVLCGAMVVVLHERARRARAAGDERRADAPERNAPPVHA